MVRIQLKDISSLLDSSEEWREQNEGGSTRRDAEGELRIE